MARITSEDFEVKTGNKNKRLANILKPPKVAKAIPILELSLFFTKIKAKSSSIVIASKKKYKAQMEKSEVENMGKDWAKK